MIKPDNISFLSTLPTYIGIGSPSNSFTISGTIPDGSGQTFSTTVLTSQNNTRFDVYGTNQHTNEKQLLSNTNFPSIYQFVSSELLQMTISYSSTSVEVQFQISNFTGASINLINQTILITVEEYMIPY